jgi:hypothetical protein
MSSDKRRSVREKATNADAASIDSSAEFALAMRCDGMDAGTNSGVDPDKGVPEAVERLTTSEEGEPIGKLSLGDDKLT